MKKTIFIGAILAGVAVLAGPKKNLSSLASCVWESVGGLIYPSGTSPGVDSPITIRQSDGGLWLGKNAWKDLPFTYSKATPINAVANVSDGDPDQMYAQFNVIDSADYNYSSQVVFGSLASATDPFSYLEVNAYGVIDYLKISFLSYPSDPVSIAAINIERNGVMSFGVFGNGAIRTAETLTTGTPGGSSVAAWKLGDAVTSGGAATITVEINGQKYAITATPIP